MSPPDGSTTLTLNDTKAEEDRMRVALGLTPEHTHPVRPADQSQQRSGRDGEGLVTVVSTRRSFEAPDTSRFRLAALMEELRVECSERAAAQQALADAQRVIQQLQTKLAHAEIAAAEALEAERTARLAAEARLLAIPRPKVSKPKVEKTAEPKRRGRPPGKRSMPETQELVAVEPKRRGRPPGQRPVPRAPKQEPVQWWLPSYAAAAKAKRTGPKN